MDSLVFTGLFSFCAALVYTYETVNGAEEPVARVTCPYCGREFTTDMDLCGRNLYGRNLRDRWTVPFFCHGT